MSRLIATTSPHKHKPVSTSQVMAWVIIALIPGILVQSYFFGWGTLIHIGLACLFAVTFESLFLAVRKRPIGLILRDNSALVTALLIGIALPAHTPWWINLIATGFAIIIAKQMYGGLGNNLFNPAMVGYALVLVSFPLQMTTTWANPNTDAPSFVHQLQIILGQISVDGFTGATPLDTYKTEVSHSTFQEITSSPLFGDNIALGWEWINLAYLAGGLLLLYKKIMTWHIPVSLLVALCTMSILFGRDADLTTPLSLHLFAGATMLGAFFIATDPVTAATTKLGKLYYGALVGILIYVIRTWGAYPDAVAFAVLLVNFAVPFIDQYTQPRTYGHNKAKRGIAKDAH